MLESADILIQNVIVLGAALLLLLFASLVLSRVGTRLLRPLLLRLDPGGELHARWGRRISRLIVLVGMLVGLLLLGGATLLTWYEEDAGKYVWQWARGVLRDPAALGWALAELAAAVLLAALVYLALSRLARAVVDGIGRIIDRVRYAKQLELLDTRIQTALRWTLVLGVVLFAAGLTPASEVIQYPLTVLTYAVVGLVASRGLAASSRLVVDVLFDANDEPAQRNVVRRYAGRLGRLATATRYALEYFVYVGTATIVVHQLTPGTLLADFGMMALRVIGILYMTRVVVEVFEVAIREVFSLGDLETDEATRHQRATLIPVATSLARYVAYILGVAIALSELGVDTTPLLAAASLVGVAVGLGAQAIVSDLVSGFFILFEGIFLVGHRIRVGEVDGVVEEIGVRITKVRDNYGILHCIPNGEIRAVASYSNKYVNAVVEFGLPLEVDLPRALAALSEHFAAVRHRYPDITGDTELVIEELRETCIWVRAVTRVRPGKDDEMQELLRLEVVAALAAARIDPPHERRLVQVVPLDQPAP